ncbi:extracellular solute-binding protein [Clostridium neuense]|uniref:Extracellular solute-binding protein n=1 Tax=Clostridium neuense TaxID=1728934 RepID=A0ABW8TL54_9CLOT
MMRKRLKGLVAAALTTAMCASLLVGCGSSSSSTKTDTSTDTATVGKANVTFKSSKPLTFSMLFNDSPTYPYKQDWLLFQQIKKITNVSLKLTVVPMSDYIQKRSLLISTGDAPEIMPKTYPGQETSFISSGAILPISDYVKYMPNFQKKVKDWNMQDDLKSIMQDNGKYYVLPGLHQTPVQDYSFAMRTDLLEKNNLKVPTTYEELEETLKKIKELYPNMSPWSDRFLFASALNIAAPTFGATYGWNMGNGEMFDKSSDKFIFSPTTKEYKNMLQYFSGLVKENC